jgi:Cys-rich protein (TIGR01571 family)
VPLPSDYPGDRLRAPFGQWKDGLCDFWSLGLCHPSLWCSLCCTQLQMAQVMTRSQLTCFGSPGSPIKTKNTFYIVLGCVIFYIMFSSTMALLELPYAESSKVPLYLTIISTAGNMLFTCWSVYSLCKTRESIRVQYGIREEYCCPARCEDLCCAFCCTCCTAAQLARHTGEYETYPGVCCTETGHPPTAPLVV